MGSGRDEQDEDRGDGGGDDGRISPGSQRAGLNGFGEYSSPEKSERDLPLHENSRHGERHRPGRSPDGEGWSVEHGVDGHEESEQIQGYGDGRERPADDAERVLRVVLGHSLWFDVERIKGRLGKERCEGCDDAQIVCEQGQLFETNFGCPLVDHGLGRRHIGLDHNL